MTLSIQSFAAILFSILGLSSAQAAPRTDIAQELIGRGNAAATYSCKDGSTLSARYEVRADRGETLLLQFNGKSAGMISRYISPVDAEINQCILGQDYEGQGIMVCYRTPTEIESIDLGRFSGHSFQTTSHCFVQSVRKSRE